jgi:hypothetical protein
MGEKIEREFSVCDYLKEVILFRLFPARGFEHCRSLLSVAS